MSRQRHDRPVIDDPEQVPDSFASEDEEREWWASHDFSRAFYERMDPGWDSAASFLLSPLYASRIPHVEHSLRVARRHLSYIRAGQRLERSAFFEARYEHALIAIVFSAAAVEAGLNLYLVAPKLRLSREHRTVLVEIPEEVQLPAARKLRVVAKACHELHQRPELVGRVADLFARRDVVAHALPPNRGEPEQDLAGAREHYEAASEFLDHLLLPAIDNRVVEDEP